MSVCVSFFFFFFLSGGGRAERCGHAHIVSRQGSGTLKMSPKSQQREKKKKTSGEWRKCDEQTCMLREVWDLETVEGRMVLH